MTADGTLYVVPSGYDIRHSSLSGGLPMAAGGLIKIRQGQIVFLDNDSGHYHPPPYTVAVCFNKDVA